MPNTIICGDALTVLRTLPGESVHCCITSPPYWGLRDYGVPGQLGLEPTPEAHVAAMVEIFREVRRVLRSDGTLWLNYGDSYAQSGGSRKDVAELERDRIRAIEKGYPTDAFAGYDGWDRAVNTAISGLKPKDLVGMPWRVAFALQADGWWLRQDIIWSKPNPMPESVTDRCTKAHEYLFLLSKSARYYFDAEAIKEEANSGTDLGILRSRIDDSTGRISGAKNASVHSRLAQGMDSRKGNISGMRNRRSVWTIATEPYSEAHFATFPQALIIPCVRAGTSERGCCSKCGAPMVRVTEPSEEYAKQLGKSYTKHEDDLGKGMSDHPEGYKSVNASYITKGWSPSCTCEADTEPCVVLDCFLGAGTSALVAKNLGRNYIGIELNPDYIALANERIGGLF